jgi:hypothetical protein
MVTFSNSFGDGRSGLIEPIRPDIARRVSHWGCPSKCGFERCQQIGRGRNQSRVALIDYFG